LASLAPLQALDTPPFTIVSLPLYLDMSITDNPQAKIVMSRKQLPRLSLSKWKTTRVFTKPLENHSSLVRRMQVVGITVSYTTMMITVAVLPDLDLSTRSEALGM
jgi:hypothetical protein